MEVIGNGNRTIKQCYDLSGTGGCKTADSNTGEHGSSRGRTDSQC